MSWTITGAQKNPVDPLFNNVSLLLHGDGANGSTTITDSSPSPKTVTAVGNAQISTAQSKFGGSSIAFDGTGDDVRIANSSDFVFPGDFTIETWTYLNSLTNYPRFWCIGNDIGSNNGLAFYWNSPIARLTLYTNGSPIMNSTANVLSAGTWQHIAVVRNGSGSNNLTLYVDGTSCGQATSTVQFTGVAANGFVIGAEYAEGFYSSLNGYIDDLRITKGVARYTSNFTPPTAPFPNL